MNRINITVTDGRFFIDANGHSECYNADLNAAAVVLGLRLGVKAEAVRGFLAALDGWQ